MPSLHKPVSPRPRARRKLGRIALCLVVLTAASAGAAHWWTDQATAHDRVRLAERSVWASLPVDPSEAVEAAPPTAGAVALDEAGAASALTHWELCGIGRMPVPPGAGGSAAELPASLGEDALRLARQQVAARLMQGSARARVVSVLMSRPSDAAGEGAWQLWSASVVRAALHSGDAQAMHWAAAACPWAADGPACRTTLLRARVRVEPDNAMHWLAWAEEEPEQSARAWEGLQRATRWTSDRLGIARTLLQESGASAGSGVAPYLMRDLLLQAQMEGAALSEPTPSDAACREAGGPTAACEHLVALVPPTASTGPLPAVAVQTAPQGCGSVAQVEARIRATDVGLEGGAGSRQ